MTLSLSRRAVFSHCRRYRYVLSRTWNTELPKVLFIALNPSTADETQDDPTVRRCVGFARSWGFGCLVIANLFAFRSTDPKRLIEVSDPVGPRNDLWLKRLSAEADMTVVAWGVHGDLGNRAHLVLSKLTKTHHLGLSKDGYPYLPRTTRPFVDSDFDFLRL